MKKLLLLLLVPALVILTASCGKSKEDEAAEKARQLELSNLTEGSYQPPKPIPLPEGTVVQVPDSVKAKYSTVTIGIGNRKTNGIKKFQVRVGETASVPGTDYRIKVMAYLPDWAYRGKVVTSKSDEPKDPAVRAIIYEKDKEVFDGFIFQNNVTPSFITQTWAIGLIGAS